MNQVAEIRGVDSFARKCRSGIRFLSVLSPVRALSAIAYDWACIVMCFTVAIQFPNPVVWVIAALLIAGRQHALLLLMHDGAHFRFHPNRRLNELISDWFTAYPFLVTTQGYRLHHLEHHNHLNTEDDPDWMRKLADADWDLPKTKLMILGILARDFFGGGMIDQLRSIVHFRKTNSQSSQKRYDRLVFLMVAAGLVTFFKLWIPVLLLWFVPIFMVVPVIMRLRSIAEHFGLPGETALNSSRNYAGPWWERMFFTPHNGGYHLDHHLFPSVPFYNLPRLNKLLNKHPEYREFAYKNDSLLSSLNRSVLSDITLSSDADANNRKETTVLNARRRRMKMQAA